MWTLRQVDQKYLESFEMWCWRRMEKIIWTDRVRNEEVLHRVDHPPPSSAEVKERVELHLYSPFGLHGLI
jgi:hypothetical protein